MDVISNLIPQDQYLMTVFHANDEELSKNDSIRVGQAYYMFVHLYRDVMEQVADLSQNGSNSDWRRTYSVNNLNNMLKLLATVDVNAFCTNLKNALQVLRHTPIKGIPVRKFKSLCRDFEYDRNLPVCNNYITPLLRFVCCNSVHHDIIRNLNTLLQFIVRLTLKDVNGLEAKCIEEYISFEEELHSREYDDIMVDVLLSTMSGIVGEWFRDFDITSWSSYHSYGATNIVKRSKGTTAKYQALDLDWKSAKSYSLLSYDTHILDKFSNLSQYSTIPTKFRYSNFQLVPKGIDKKRGISMEDTTNQHIQGLLFTCFDKHFEKHPEMKISLHNQEYNRHLCLQSSKTHNYGTVDLSSASDSVTWSIVKRVFSETPYELQKCMYLSRTNTVIIDTLAIAIEKAYPMGSCLCFPIECVIFSAIVAAANQHLGKNTHYRIYGDDMIVHKDIWSLVLYYLKLLGFKVNETKSFPPESDFKESCGMESIMGYDISPLRISRKWDYVEMSKSRDKYHNTSTQLTALYDMGNQAFLFGYKYLRKLIIGYALKFYAYPIFSHSFEKGFFTNASSPMSNYKTRYRKSLQRLEVMVTSVRSKVANGSSTVRYACTSEYQYLAEEGSNSHFDDYYIPKSVGTAYTWVTYVWLAVEELLSYSFE